MGDHWDMRDALGQATFLVMARLVARPCLWNATRSSFAI
jgi:hypothetical protein